MASKIAREYLASQGVVISGHNAIGRGNFATGRGVGKLSSPFHIVEVDSRHGTAKRTIGWARTLDDARTQSGALSRIERSKFDHRTGLRITPEEFTNQGGASFHESRLYYYIVDIRTNEQVS